MGYKLTGVDVMHLMSYSGGSLFVIHMHIGNKNGNILYYKLHP